MLVSELSDAAVHLFFDVIPSRFGGWQQSDEITPDGRQIVWSAPYELRKLTASWTRAVGLTPPQDAAQCTFHFLNLTAGEPDSTWIDSDFTTVESAFNTMWDSLTSTYPATVKLSEYAWRKDGPAYRPHTPAPGGLLSPTIRVVPKSVAGVGSTEALPPQVAISVTEVIPATFTVTDVEGSGTQVRNRWGRFYLPAPAVQMGINSNLTAGGRLRVASAAAIAGYVKTFYDACNAADIVPVVYSPTTGNSWAVQSLHVDDIFDVIRSRRYVEPLSRSVVALTDPPPEL